jgi:endonuclease/exonuclease/phosphatase family metal-dependent hydrolase
MTPSHLPTRRQALATCALGGLALAGMTRLTHAAEDKPLKSLRVIAYNVYKCTGFPKDRALGKKATALGQMPQRFAHELALYEPDIIAFSESPSEAVTNEIAKHLKMNVVRFPSGGNWPGTLFSRFEIAGARNVPLKEGERPQDLFTRHWGSATIKLPGGQSLLVHSAHLHPGVEPDVRLKEIRLMLEAMRADLAAGRSMLLIGDLNHRPTPPEYPLWLDAGWVDTFAKVGQGEGLTFQSEKDGLKLNKRIDFVLAAGPIANQVVESRPLYEGAFRVNIADPESFALSDHVPQLAVFALDK